MPEELLDEQDETLSTDIEDSVDEASESEEEAGGRQLSPLAASIEAMAEAQAQEDPGTIVNALGEEIVSDEMSDEEYDEEDPEPERPEPESPVFKNDDGEYAVELTVNGQKVTRTLKEITADRQKDLAAEQRLQQAAMRNKELDARETALREREAEIARQLEEQKESQLSSQDAGLKDLDKAKAFIDRVLDGETDNAAEQLAELIASGRTIPTPVDANAISQRAAQDAISKIEAMNAEKAYTSSVKKGADWVNEHHPEITASESLTRFVDAEINVIMANEPGTEPEKAIKKATETVLKQLGKPGEAESSRSTNKAGLRREPARKAISKKRVEKEVIDNSPRAIIAEMRKERAALTGKAY